MNRKASRAHVQAVGTAAVCLRRNRLRAWMVAIIMAIGDPYSKKNQAIPLNYTWLPCTLPRYTYHRFIDPFINKKEGRLVDTSPQKWEQRMFTGLSA